MEEHLIYQKKKCEKKIGDRQRDEKEEARKNIGSQLLGVPYVPC